MNIGWRKWQLLVKIVFLLSRGSAIQTEDLLTPIVACSLCRSHFRPVSTSPSPIAITLANSPPFVDDLDANNMSLLCPGAVPPTTAKMVLMS